MWGKKVVFDSCQDPFSIKAFKGNFIVVFKVFFFFWFPSKEVSEGFNKHVGQANV